MKNKSILFISYFTGFNGNCPAEWADDKLRVLENKNIRTIILTGLGSNAINTKYMKYCKIPSLSWDDFFHEKKMVFQNNNNKKIIYLIFPIILLFGKLIQYATSLITQKGSGGKWSWAIITLFVALYFVITRKVEVVFCTGGPTSSHLVGSIIGKLTKARVINEFQDPLVGAKINSSNYKMKMTIYLEKFFIKNSIKTYFVTEKASKDAQNRYSDIKHKIDFKYPGAWNFNLKRQRLNNENRVFEFLHLGTLYGSRNLDNIFKALDELYEDNDIVKGEIKILNLGSVYCETKDQYLRRDDFEIIEETGRINALKRANLANCLIIIQHNDNRSIETIPYKTYDYLNLQKPLLAIINNDEIVNLLNKNNNISENAHPDNIIEIKEKIKKTVYLSKMKRKVTLKYNIFPDINLQFLEMINN